MVNFIFQGDKIFVNKFKNIHCYYDHKTINAFKLKWPHKSFVQKLYKQT